MVLARVVDGAVLAHAPRAEVEAADELADDQHVDVAGDRRTQVGVHVERRAQREQSLLRTDVAGLELRVADRALEHGGRAAARVERLLRQRRPRRADRRRAEEPFLDLDVGREQLEHESRLLGDLGPDAVSRQEHDPGAATRRQARPPRARRAGGRAAAG